MNNDLSREDLTTIAFLLLSMVHGLKQVCNDNGIELRQLQFVTPLRKETFLFDDIYEMAKARLQMPSMDVHVDSTNV